jgi:hypothetical protein
MSTALVLAVEGDRLPVELVGPVELALAKAVEQVPGEHALSGGCVYEPKWDGYLH